MDLTVTTEKLPNGRWKAYLSSTPEIFYIGDQESSVQERMSRLTTALRSPHIQVERILPDGDVILTLRREREEEVFLPLPLEDAFFEMTAPAMA